MLSILIVDDHSVVRQGVRRILETGLGPVEVTEANDGPEALLHVERRRFDLAILDLAMPGQSGVEVLKDMKRIAPNLTVLVFSMYPESQLALRIIKAGASGYVTKDSPPRVLIEAINRVLLGGTYISSDLSENLVGRIQSGYEGQPHEQLSDREFQVMLLLARGVTLTDIAEQMVLSVKTISTYRTRIVTKMDMKSNAEIVQYAIRNGLLE